MPVAYVVLPVGVVDPPMGHHPAYLVDSVPEGWQNSWSLSFEAQLLYASPATKFPTDTALVKLLTSKSVERILRFHDPLCSSVRLL